EVDVNRVKVGQRATISSDAIPGESIAGKIVTVSSEASQQQGFGDAATFGVRVTFSPQTDAQRQAVRLGMSAKISIQIYENATAIVVPLQAISDGTDDAKATIIHDGERETVSVTLGQTFPAGVEILSGLKVGDQILIGGHSSSSKPTVKAVLR